MSNSYGTLKETNEGYSATGSGVYMYDGSGGMTNNPPPAYQTGHQQQQYNQQTTNQSSSGSRGGGGVVTDDGCVCCCCFDSGPHPDDKYAEGVRTFQTTMCNAPCADPLCCMGSFFCLPCAQYVLREKVLERDMTKYSCCQGYFDDCWKCCCCSNGLGEQNCPACCLCLESFCCPGLAVSASRMYVMDKYNIRSDPCDRRLIIFNNCIQTLSCICSCLAMITGNKTIRDLARLLRLISEIVFLSVAACMTTQVSYEIDHIAAQGYQHDGPMKQTMN